jgi:transcription elongation factor Elf1
MMKSKAVWWTTGIFAVIGVSQGLFGIFVFGILGFLVSFTVVGLHRANQKSKQQNGKSLLTKMVDDQAQAENRKASIRRTKLKEKMKCPRCGSRNIQTAGAHKGSFSVAKAAGGTILAGGVGSLAGFAGKRTGKSDWVCLDCGKSFTIK